MSFSMPSISAAMASPHPSISVKAGILLAAAVEAVQRAIAVTNVNVIAIPVQPPAAADPQMMPRAPRTVVRRVRKTQTHHRQSADLPSFHGTEVPLHGRLARTLVGIQSDWSDVLHA